MAGVERIEATVTTAIEREVATVLRQAEISTDETLIVALSGGADSLTLTAALRRLRDAGTGPRLVAVHVHHGLRPEADAEAEQVVALGKRLDVPVEVVRVDVAAWDRVLRQGIEAAARAARYAALAAQAQTHDTPWLAVGHTASDQAETVLLRLARGTSLDGLGGMRVLSTRPVPLQPTDRDGPPLRILRPLLGLPRRAVEAYIAARGLEAIEDPSNRWLTYRRNIVRHTVLPALEQVSEGAVAAIGRTSRLLGDDAEFLQTVATDAAERVITAHDGLVLMAREALRRLHPAIQRRVVIAAVSQAGLDPAAISAERVEAVRVGAIDGPVSSMIEVGDGIAGWIDYDAAAFGPQDQLPEALRLASDLPLLEPGTKVFLEAGMRVDVPLGNRWRLCGEIGPSAEGWCLRTRREGDRLSLPGGPTVRMKHWLINQKVPAYVRDWLPMLAVAGRVVWVGGLSEPEFRDEAAGVRLRLMRDEGE